MCPSSEKSSMRSGRTGQPRTTSQQCISPGKVVSAPLIFPVCTNEFLQVRMNARALKARLRDRLRQQKFEMDRVERSHRKTASGKFNTMSAPLMLTTKEGMGKGIERNVMGMKRVVIVVSVMRNHRQRCKCCFLLHRQSCLLRHHERASRVMECVEGSKE
jgi:hypothetical protein